MQLIERLLLPAFRKKRLTNDEIYAGVHARARRAQIKLSPHWKATIRNTLQRHARGNPKCKGNPIFIHRSRATWELRK